MTILNTINSIEQTERAISTGFCTLKDIPEEFKTLKICRQAILNDPAEIQHVPEELRIKLITIAQQKFEEKYLSKKQRNLLHLIDYSIFASASFALILITIMGTSLVWNNFRTQQNAYTHAALNQSAKTASANFVTKLLTWNNQTIIANINEATEMCEQTGISNIRNFILSQGLTQLPAGKISSRIKINDIRALDIGQPTIKINYTRTLVIGTKYKVTNESAYITLLPSPTISESYTIKNFVIEKK